MKEWIIARISNNMAKLPHFALDFDAIEPTLDEFFSTRTGYSHAFFQENDFTYKVSVQNDNGKKPGLITIYNKQGLYCMDIGGAPQFASICHSCSDFILERLKIPSAERLSFSVKNVDVDIVELCLQYLDKNYTLSDEKADVPNARHYIVSDSYRSSVSIICYENGTLLIQGAYTALFLKVVTEITRETETAPETAVEELMRIAPMVEKRYDVDINKLVNKPKPLKDNHLDVMVLSSIILANSAIALGDYGAYSFGILKTIEGLLSLKLQAHFSRDCDPFSNCFTQDSSGIQRLTITDYDSPSFSSLKKAIEDSYNFYHKNRHTTFHIKKLNVGTSRLLTHEEAIDMIDDGLELINNLCDNW